MDKEAVGGASEPGDRNQGGSTGVPGAAAVCETAQTAPPSGRRLVLQLDLRAGPRSRGRRQVPLLPLGGGRRRPEPARRHCRTVGDDPQGLFQKHQEKELEERRKLYP
ncbi:uncharacterized protein C17orf100 homolog isoform X5 [Rhinopithecus roxellana]|uniref:uncharacterized protein C17orf100 homolog isoform X5 n=1 Tax=Rhinopithecus roxellana TaxID=61622 RepID=UPI001237705C|nr:uncharacterized protein C17orf100 homolog isoform X5 [Rhinopithecus roxellana]